MCHVMVWCSREYPTSRDRYQDILADLPFNGETLLGKRLLGSIRFIFKRGFSPKLEIENQS